MKLIDIATIIVFVFIALVFTLIAIDPFGELIKPTNLTSE